MKFDINNRVPLLFGQQLQTTGKKIEEDNGQTEEKKKK